MTPPTALVVALAYERRALAPLLAGRRAEPLGEVPCLSGTLGDRPVLLIQAGIGFTRARQAVEAAARHRTLSGVWSLGLAGGLSDALRPGELLCASRVVSDAAPPAGTARAVPAAAAVQAALAAAGLPCRLGPLFTSRVPLRTPEAKRAAAARTGAIAVDMEAAGAMAAAEAMGLPALALKAIVDPVGDPLPGWLACCTSPAGDACWWRLVGCALASGENRRALRRLGRDAGLGGAALRRALPPALDAWAVLTTPGLFSTV
jgi:nucleoside phosphorylase